MSKEHHHSQKQSFLPYAIMIIVAVIIIAIANATAVYYANIATVERDEGVIHSQQYIIDKLAKDYAINTQILNKTADGIQSNLLYQGQILYQLMNNSKVVAATTQKLDTLITSHNEMIKAIEQVTGIHTPIIINKNTVIHNTFCSIKIVTPKCNHLPIKK